MSHENKANRQTLSEADVEKTKNIKNNATEDNFWHDRYQ